MQKKLKNEKTERPVVRRGRNGDGLMGWRQIENLDELPDEFLVSHNDREVDFGHVFENKIVDKNGMELDYEFWRPIDFSEPPVA